MSSTIAQACGMLTHGLYVIGVTDQKLRNAFTAAWVMQVSFDPVMIAFSINPEHYSYRLLISGKVCSVNVLDRGQMTVADHFGRSNPDKMTGYKWREVKTGAPVLCDCLAYFDCEVSHYADAGDHKLVVCDAV